MKEFIARLYTFVALELPDNLKAKNASNFRYQFILLSIHRQIEIKFSNQGTKDR